MKDTFIEYIEKKIGDNLYYVTSVKEIVEEWNMSIKDTFYALGLLNNYQIKFHPDDDSLLIIVDKVKAQAVAERKKDKHSRQ